MEMDVLVVSEYFSKFATFLCIQTAAKITCAFPQYLLVLSEYVLRNLLQAQVYHRTV